MHGWWVGDCAVVAAHNGTLVSVHVICSVCCGTATSCKVPPKNTRAHARLHAFPHRVGDDCHVGQSALPVSHLPPHKRGKGVQDGCGVGPGGSLGPEPCQAIHTCVWRDDMKPKQPYIEPQRCCTEKYAWLQAPPFLLPLTTSCACSLLPVHASTLCCPTSPCPKVAWKRWRSSHAADQRHLCTHVPGWVTATETLIQATSRPPAPNTLLRSSRHTFLQCLP
jgi:hypothetical protein